MDLIFEGLVATKKDATTLELELEPIVSLTVTPLPKLLEKNYHERLHRSLDQIAKDMDLTLNEEEVSGKMKWTLCYVPRNMPRRFTGKATGATTRTSCR